MGRRFKIPQGLLIRHFVDGKLARTHILRRPEMKIGAHPKSRIVVRGDGVAERACKIQFKDGGWYVVDAQSGVTINGRSSKEHLIKDEAEVKIGVHTLHLKQLPKRDKIFNFDEKRKGGTVLNVVKWHGNVIKASMNEIDISAFLNQEQNKIEVIRYNMRTSAPIGPEKFHFDPELKKPMLSSLGVFLVFLLVLIGIPMSKQEQKPADNTYTRMIYDSKILTQRKKALQSFGMRNPKGTGNGNGEISEGTKSKQTAATKAITSLRKSGVQSLISKIAGRAGLSAKMVLQMAATADANAAIDKGSAMPSAGTVVGKSALGGRGSGFKLTGIGTGGKGGGTGGYKNGTGLGTGSIGNGEVGLEDTESVVEGGLDREVIAGVIREHLGQIRYCYERQLSANPDLYGKIKVQFSIGSDGVVETQSVGQSTLKNALVEECILRRIATWKFPKPKGGTKVLVSYPFLFKSVN